MLADGFPVRQGLEEEGIVTVIPSLIVEMKVYKPLVHIFQLRQVRRNRT